MQETYADRLALAMGLSAAEFPKLNDDDKRKIIDLAHQLGVTRQAVEKYFRDSSTAMTAPNNVKAARVLKVDSEWLALGDRPMRSERAWPFGLAITPADYFRLEPEATLPVMDLLTAAISRLPPAASKPGHRRKRGGP